MGLYRFAINNSRVIFTRKNGTDLFFKANKDQLPLENQMFIKRIQYAEEGEDISAQLSTSYRTAWT